MSHCLYLQDRIISQARNHREEGSSETSSNLHVITLWEYGGLCCLEPKRPSYQGLNLIRTLRSLHSLAVTKWRHRRIVTLADESLTTAIGSEAVSRAFTSHLAFDKINAGDPRNVHDDRVRTLAPQPDWGISSEVEVLGQPASINAGSTRVVQEVPISVQTLWPFLWCSLGLPA